MKPLGGFDLRGDNVHDGRRTILPCVAIFTLMICIIVSAWGTALMQAIHRSLLSMLLSTLVLTRVFVYPFP